MTNQVKAAAVCASTAAAIIGGSVLLVPVNDTDRSIDVALPVVNVPTVTVPTVSIPKIDVAVNVPQLDTTVETPQMGKLTVTAPQIDTTVETPQMGKLTVTAPQIDTTVETPQMGKLTVTAPQIDTTVETPQMGKLTVTAPQIDTTVETPLINTAAASPQVSDLSDLSDLSDIKTAAIATPQVTNPAKRIPLVQKFFDQCKRFFRDQRMIRQDRSLGIDNAAAAQWLEIYRQNQKYDLEFVRMPAGIRMIAEIHHPINQRVLRKNLAFYKKQNFNAALLTFGFTGEKLSDLLYTAEVVKSTGMKLFIAYAGPEDLKHSVLQDPDELAEKIKVLSIHADGFLLNWRRTSLHLFEQDPAYVNYVLKQVRAWNKNIAVLGEAYYGQTASSNHKLRNLQYNVPENVSGVMISGLGYNGVAVESVLNKILTKIKEQSKIALITGDRPYYATRSNNGKTFAQNLEIKKALADRWLSAGASGVIVLHGDGSDGIYNKEHTDNIADKEVLP